MKLKEIFDHLIQENDLSDDNYYHYESTFLDRFYSNPSLDKLIAEPTENNGITKVLYARIAAIAHYLANKYEYEPPEWVFKEKYFLPEDEPYFQCNAQGDAMIILIILSPPEFTVRNMYVMDTTLERC